MVYPLVKPSDARAWSLCTRRVWLDNNGEFGEAPLDPFEQMVIDIGLYHEQLVLENLQSTKDVREASSVVETQNLMAQGVDVIYQAQLFDEVENISGYPDFLLKHKSGAYQPADAKLSQSADKKEIEVQLGLYRQLLGTSLPGIVFLGDGSQGEIGDETNSLCECSMSTGCGIF
jgi:predicted RecB family nuclease